jgi:hypothetical protein
MFSCTAEKSEPLNGQEKPHTGIVPVFDGPAFEWLTNMMMLTP